LSIKRQIQALNNPIRASVRKAKSASGKKAMTQAQGGEVEFVKENVLGTSRSCEWGGIHKQKRRRREIKFRELLKDLNVIHKMKGRLLRLTENLSDFGKRIKRGGQEVSEGG